MILLGRDSSSETSKRTRQLAVSGITVRFGALAALSNVDFFVDRGEIVGLIGPNGAGKTTLVNVLTGYQRPTEGSVELDGRVITRMPPDRRAHAGIVRSFQAGRLFPRLSARENVAAAAIGTGASMRRAMGRADGLLHLLDLAHLGAVAAGALPHGADRLVAIARALASAPSFLLLDEPAAGLDESESDALLGSLAEVRDAFDLGLVVIEHDMRLVMRLCERLHVLDHGYTIAVGPPGEVRHDPRVLEAYLGTEGAWGALG